MHLTFAAVVGRSKMPRCDTKSGPFQCDQQHGHGDECKTTAKEYAVVNSSTFNHVLLPLENAMKLITKLRHVEEAARSLVRVPPGSERYEERRSDLISALKDIDP